MLTFPWKPHTTLFFLGPTCSFPDLISFSSSLFACFPVLSFLHSFIVNMSPFILLGHWGFHLALVLCLKNLYSSFYNGNLMLHICFKKQSSILGLSSPILWGKVSWSTSVSVGRKPCPSQLYEWINVCWVLSHILCGDNWAGWLWKVLHHPLCTGLTVSTHRQLTSWAELRSEASFGRWSQWNSFSLLPRAQCSCLEVGRSPGLKENLWKKNRIYSCCCVWRTVLFSYSSITCAVVWMCPQKSMC